MQIPDTIRTEPRMSLDGRGRSRSASVRFKVAIWPAIEDRVRFFGLDNPSEYLRLLVAQDLGRKDL